MKYSIALPNGWKMSLVEIKDPVEAYETMTNVARAADETGFAAIWLVDHFHTVPVPSQEVTFECWMSLAALARDTKRVRVGPIVSCNSYRNSALLAKMASTLDVLSHGRLNFGIGAGWYEHEYRAYGYPFPSAPEHLRQLREALQIIHAMWEQEEATFQGQLYSHETCSRMSYGKRRADKLSRVVSYPQPSPFSFPPSSPPSRWGARATWSCKGNRTNGFARTSARSLLAPETTLEKMR